MSVFIVPGWANARWRIAAIATVAVSLVAGFTWWRRAAVDPPLVATVRKGALTAQLTTSGTLRPIQSITYRSPLAGLWLLHAGLLPDFAGRHRTAASARCDVDRNDDAPQVTRPSHGGTPRPLGGALRDC